MRYVNEYRSADAVSLQTPVFQQLPFAESLFELESLIGLDEVKKMLWEIIAFALMQRKRCDEKLTADSVVLHMIFKGNPGTGKTTVARILGRIFHQAGILSNGKMVEAERADLVGEYIGHTAQKTREMIRKAGGGILFIDEAYTLAQGGMKDFGREAIATLVKAMEDQKDHLIVILAGYNEEMDGFLRVNPGLRSRFPVQIDFPDYDHEALFAIALQMLVKREYTLTPKARWKLKNVLSLYARGHHQHGGNARYVRNLIEKCVRLQAMRLISAEKISREELMTLTDADIPAVF